MRILLATLLLFVSSLAIGQKSLKEITGENSLWKASESFLGRQISKSEYLGFTKWLKIPTGIVHDGSAEVNNALVNAPFFSKMGQHGLWYSYREHKYLPVEGRLKLKKSCKL